MSQNFRLLHVSNLSVRNFLIFLLMYPVSWTEREAPPAVSGQVIRVGWSVWGTGEHPPAPGLKSRERDLSADSRQRTANAGPDGRCRLATLSGASSAQAVPMSPPTPTREAFYPRCSAGARQTAELTGAARWMNLTPLSRSMFSLYLYGYCSYALFTAQLQDMETNRPLRTLMSRFRRLRAEFGLYKPELRTLLHNRGIGDTSVWVWLYPSAPCIRTACMNYLWRMGWPRQDDIVHVKVCGGRWVAPGNGDGRLQVAGHPSAAIRPAGSVRKSVGCAGP